MNPDVAVIVFLNKTDTKYLIMLAWVAFHKDSDSFFFAQNTSKNISKKRSPLDRKIGMLFFLLRIQNHLNCFREPGLLAIRPRRKTGKGIISLVSQQWLQLFLILTKY
tara:strand:+ start:94 stop:417 length:324 start_codon:yes stop_codon:yes gene_type:complete